MDNTKKPPFIEDVIRLVHIVRLWRSQRRSEWPYFTERFAARVYL